MRAAGPNSEKFSFVLLLQSVDLDNFLRKDFYERRTNTPPPKRFYQNSNHVALHFAAGFWLDESGLAGMLTPIGSS